MIEFPGFIPIRIFPIFWIMAIALGWLQSQTWLGTCLWTFVILLSVLVHEFGHALTSLIFGQKATISLTGFGGLTQRDGPKLSAWKEFLIVLAGPLAGFLLFILAKEAYSFLNPQNQILQYFLTIMIYANLFWTIVNLIPVQPLDGGHLLSILLQGLFGYRGIKISFFVSMILGLLLSVGFLLLQAPIACILFLLFTFESYKMWKSSLSISFDDRKVELQNLLSDGEKAIEEGNKQEAKKLFEDILNQSHEGKIYQAASFYLAKILEGEGNISKAYALLKPFQKELPLDSLILLQQLSFRLNQWQEAIKIGQTVHQEYPHYEVALLNALSHAHLKEAQPAAGWLQRAFQEGLPDAEKVFFNQVWDPIRDSPYFKKLLDKQLSD